MPKGGKRAGGTPDHEIQEAADRMRKRPEHRKSARNSQEWQDFLVDIGVETSSASFWEKVRGRVRHDIRQEATPSRARVEHLEKEHNITAEFNKVYRDASGHFTSKPDGNDPVTIYRGASGKFVSTEGK